MNLSRFNGIVALYIVLSFIRWMNAEQCFQSTLFSFYSLQSVLVEMFVFSLLIVGVNKSEELEINKR